MKTNYSSNCYDNASLGADLRIPESPELERAVLRFKQQRTQYGPFEFGRFRDPQVSPK